MYYIWGQLVFCHPKRRNSAAHIYKGGMKSVPIDLMSHGLSTLHRDLGHDREWGWQNRKHKSQSLSQFRPVWTSCSDSHAVWIYHYHGITLSSFYVFISSLKHQLAVGKRRHIENWIFPTHYWTTFPIADKPNCTQITRSQWDRQL